MGGRKGEEDEWLQTFSDSRCTFRREGSLTQCKERKSVTFPPEKSHILRKQS